jgi:hypothetical protein
VNYAFNPHSILQSGAYDLTLIGVNWGGPWSFNVTTTPPIAGLAGSGTGGIGVVFMKTVSITV